jgi:porin
MCKVLIRALTVLAALTCVVAAARAEDAAGASKNSGTKDPTEALADAGIQFSATYIGEGLASVSGGVRAGQIYTGRLDLGTTVDLEKIAGWTGATFHANMFQIHGEGLSGNYIGNLMLVSGVEALPATRLYELWVEQKLWGDKLLIRVGQQASDVEFIDSLYDDLFVNSALGWPGITGIDVPAGGPSPPLAVPGIRIKAYLSEQITAYLALFDGDAAPPDSPLDPQLANAHGTLFRVKRSALVDRAAQIQIRYRSGQAVGIDHGRRLVSHDVVSGSALLRGRTVSGRPRQFRRTAVAAAEQRRVHGL